MQTELLNNLKSLPNNYLTLLELSDDLITTNSIKQNADFLASKIEVFILNLDKKNSNYYQILNCYHTFLIIADNLEKITSLINNPSNLLEYIYYYYAVYMLGIVEKPSVVNEKLKKLILLNKSDSLSMDFAQLVLDLQTGRCSTQDFLQKFEDLYNENLGFFLNNSIILIAFMRMYIFLLINSKNFINLIKQWYEFSKKHNYEFSLMILSHLQGMITGYNGRLDTARDYNLESLKISTSLNYINQYSTKNNLGNIYTSLGSYEKAGDIYRELLEKQPINNIFLLNLAENYLFLNDYQKGLDVINEYEKKFGSLKNTNNNLALEIKFILLLRLNRLQEAIEVENEANQGENLGHLISTNKLVYNRMLAMHYQYEGNYAQAKQKMDDVLKIAEELNRIHELFINYMLLIEIQLDLVIMRPNFQEYRNQLFSLIDMLIKLSEEQDIIYQKIKLLVLRSEVYKHFNLLEEANNDLQEAKTLAQERDYDDLFKKITLDIQKLRENELGRLGKDKTSSNFLNRLKNAFKVLIGSPMQNKNENILIISHSVTITAILKSINISVDTMSIPNASGFIINFINEKFVFDSKINS